MNWGSDDFTKTKFVKLRDCWHIQKEQYEKSAVAKSKTFSVDRYKHCYALMTLYKSFSLKLAWIVTFTI